MKVVEKAIAIVHPLLILETLVYAALDETLYVDHGMLHRSCLW